MHWTLRALLVVTAAVLPEMTFAVPPAPSFSDVPESHPAFHAIEYLTEKGIVHGYSDSTFQPDRIVNRAEAVTMIVRATRPAKATTSIEGEHVYSDVSRDAWFAQALRTARETLRIIDGPPARTVFFPSEPVKKAEFIKMLLIARKIAATSDFGDLKGSLASDAADVTAWYFPFLRYALASSMTAAENNGLLLPSAPLSRGDVTLLMMRLSMYQEGRRTEVLLATAEREMGRVVKLLEAKNPVESLQASHRSVLAVRGALAAKPDDALVKAYVKTAEGFQMVVRAYGAGKSGKLPNLLQFTSDAWHLAEKAKAFDASLATLATQLQGIAKGMADEARALGAGR